MIITVRVAKKYLRIINTITFIWSEHMLGNLSLGIKNTFLKAHSFA